MGILKVLKFTLHMVPIFFLSRPCYYDSVVVLIQLIESWKFWWKAGDFMSSHSERKSGFMKWLGKLFKGGSHRSRGGRHLHEPAEENMAWRAPSRALVNIVIGLVINIKYHYCFA